MSYQKHNVYIVNNSNINIDYAFKLYYYEYWNNKNKISVYSFYKVKFVKSRDVESCRIIETSEILDIYEYVKIIVKYVINLNLKNYRFIYCGYCDDKIMNWLIKIKQNPIYHLEWIKSNGNLTNFNLKEILNKCYNTYINTLFKIFPKDINLIIIFYF